MLFFSDGKDTECRQTEKIFRLFVLRSVLGALRYFYLGFTLVSHTIQAITAAKDKCREYKQLYME
jgi:hypothetical protein